MILTRNNILNGALTLISAGLISAAAFSGPPADWPAERKREYFEWAGEVVAGCRGVNAKLEGWFDGAYAAR